MNTKREDLSDKPEKDPEWIKEIVSFLITNKDQAIINKYRKLFRELYFDYLREGLKPKEAIEKAKNVVASFKINEMKE